MEVNLKNKEYFILCLLARTSLKRSSGPVNKLKKNLA
jgi:hypothetical protein